MQISNNKLVTAEYQLFVKNADGSLELMEQTTPDNPLKYFHGAGMMLPKFEEHLEGKKVGESIEFSIDAKDAYGERSEDNIIDLPLNIFTNDGTLDEERFFPGAIVPLVDTNGERINAEIVEIGAEDIKVDLNHPLAGENLFFKVKVLDAHIPTDEEIMAMNSAGGGCSGCSSGSCGDGGCGIGSDDDEGCGCGGNCTC